MRKNTNKNLGEACVLSVEEIRVKAKERLSRVFEASLEGTFNGH
jgi:hypothetical protein